VLGLSVATAAAVADPADESTPPSSATTDTTPTSDTTPTAETSAPTETSASTEPSTPPPSSSSPEEEPREQPAKEPEKERADEPAVRSIQDIEMTATFDKPSYNTGEKMSITVTVRNNGTEDAAIGVGFYPSDKDGVEMSLPNPFEDGNRFTLPAGGSVTHKLSGATGNPNVTTAKLYGLVSGQSAGRQFVFSVPIKKTTGHAAGTVYTDRNDNGKFDGGEGQSGVTLTWASRYQYGTTLTATTNAAGEFGLDVPTGLYGVYGAGPDGLQVGYQQFTVDQSDVDGLLLRAVGAITGLSVDLAFTKDTYARDEAPVVRVTLTNDADVPLHGIIASCDRGGFGNELQGVDDGWGDLAYHSGGVTLAPHSTTVLDVTEPMPAGAYDYGYVVVGCDFGYEGVDDPDHNASDFDLADVPGQHGDLDGIVADDDTRVAGVRLVLVPEDGGCPVAEVTSDANGEFLFKQVPVGLYDLYVFPPAGWHVEYDNPTPTYVIGQYPGSMYIELAQGDAAAPTLPNCPSGGPTTPAPPPAPAPQGSPAPAGLAETGASIVAPGIIGLLAVLTGAGAVIATRRRKQAKES
jgi:hypothetical protein